MSVNTLTRPTTPTADSWRDTRQHRRCSSATSFLNSTAAQVGNERGRVMTHHHIIHNAGEQTDSICYSQTGVWPLSTTIPRSLCSGRGRTCWAASGQQSWNITAAVKAILTQCVFVNEPDDEVGQGLNSWGDGAATARRLQLQGAEAHYEWIKH